MNKNRTQTAFRLFVSLITLLSLSISPIRPTSAVFAQDPSPHIDVWVDTHSISGYQWPNGASMSLTIIDAENGTYQPDPQTFTDYVQFDVPDTFPLRAGQQVTLTDGTTARTTTIAALPEPTIDVANSQISGTTDPGATVWIYLCNQDGCVNRWITADSSGAYLFDFMAGEGDHIHLYPGDNSSVNVADANGNNTSRSWRILNPNIQASANKRWVIARDWPAGQTLTLSVNGVASGTDVVGTHPWNQNDIMANFDLPALEVGDVLQVENEDHSITKTLTISPVNLTGINLAASTLSGIATPDSVVDVGVDDPNLCLVRRVQADAQGNWSADFATPSENPGDCGTTTFGPVIKGWANNYEPDKDATFISWAMPHVDVFLNRNSVAAYDWAVGMDLTLTVTQPSAAPYTQTAVNGGVTSETQQGFTQFNLPAEVLLTPGQQVTVSGGSISQTTTIQNLEAPSIDQANSRLTGNASTGAVISTCLNNVWPCIPRSTTVNARGVYVLDFGVAGPNPGEDRTRAFQPNDGGVLHWADGKGNYTSLDWHIPAHTLHVNPLDQEIHGHDWPEGVEATLTLDDPSTGAHKVVTQTVIDRPNQCGTPCFHMADIGWTLAPGQVVTMSEGISSRTVTVSPLRTTRIDALHDVMVGIADPNSPISIGESTSGIQARFVWADDNGDWSVDFSAVGPVNHETNMIDLVKNSTGRVVQLNPPGWGMDDGTLQYWTAGDPMILSADQINENAPAGSVVGTFSPTYPDVVQTLAYSLVAGEGDTDNAAFTIDGNALKIKASPNYESQPSYSIRVQVVDSLAPGKSYETTYAISVVDVDEPATQISLNPHAISENSPAGSLLGTFSTNDPDAGETYTYSLVSGEGSSDNGAFTLDGNALHLNAASDYETQTAYSIRVRAAENRAPGSSLEQSFTINVTNIVEPPVVTSFHKSGPQNNPIPFSAADFNEHFQSRESINTAALEKIKITALPTHGTLQVEGGAALVQGSEIPAASLGQLTYQPETNFAGNDLFTWTAADNTGYAEGSAQVVLVIDTVIEYGLEVSPAGDMKSTEPGKTAAYTLFLSNTGSIPDSYSIALQGTRKWTTTVTPQQVVGLDAGGQQQLTVDVAVPANASGSDTAVLEFTSQGDTGQKVSVQLVTTAAAPPSPYPVLLGVNPSSAAYSELGSITLTLSGANFTQPMTVQIGGSPSPAVILKSSVQLTAYVPAGLQPGAYPVQVCDALSRCATLDGAFTVVDNTPSALSLTPNYGHNYTANPVSISGYNMSVDTTLVLLGSTTSQTLTEKQITGGVLQATIPAGLPPGAYSLQVCNGSVCSVLENAYTALEYIQNDFAAAADDLWISPVTIREGNTITLSLTVHRISGVGQIPVQVAFYRDDPSVPANKIGVPFTDGIGPMPVGTVATFVAEWTPVGIMGPVRIFAVIDPDHQVAEATRANNVVSTTIQILPRENRDETPPAITGFVINGGGSRTTSPAVNVALYAMENPGGSGLSNMMITERVFNTAAQQWVVTQSVGWIPYQPNFQWGLTPVGGVHYLEAWVSDRAGNTSAMAQAKINYQTPPERIYAGQTIYYRFTLGPGVAQHYLLESISGDADIYVRGPDGSPVAYSATAAPIERVDFTTRMGGVYQVEIFGYQTSFYTVNFQADLLTGQASTQTGKLAAGEKTPRWQPSISVQNEPMRHNPGTQAPIIPWGDGYKLFLPLIAAPGD